MRLPEFTAEASLGKMSGRYVLTSGYRAGASNTSLQPQLLLHSIDECTILAMECILSNNCDTYNKYCAAPSGGSGGGSTGGRPPGPGSTTVFSGVS
jgi:hypothetical protein